MIYNGYLSQSGIMGCVDVSGMVGRDPKMKKIAFLSTLWLPAKLGLGSKSL